MGRIIITGTYSGCGKTTVTCAVLEAIKNRGIDVNSFKGGPDYLEPTFKREILGIKSYNIDSFMMSENTIKSLLAEHPAQVSVIDGSMGYYDGIRFTGKASTCELSLITKTPAVVVIDCNDKGASAAAELHGFLTYKKNMIKGVIFNRVSAAQYEELKEICGELKVRCCGYMPVLETDMISNPHLTLITDSEIEAIKERVAHFGEQAAHTLDIDAILEIAADAKELKAKPVKIERIGNPKIAISRDRAFCFYYADNLELLERMGAELVSFSPLKDEKLPDGIDGLILCGGYIEMYGAELAKNTSMLESIRNAINGGLPTIAECGGFMYMHNSMIDITGIKHKMAGVIDGECVRVTPPNSYGYVELEAQSDSLLFRKGARAKTYEFHRYESTCSGTGVSVIKNGEELSRIYVTDTLYAGFPHVHFYSNIEMAQRFMEACAK